MATLGSLSFGAGRAAVRAPWRLFRSSYHMPKPTCPQLQLRKNQPAWNNEEFPALSREKSFSMLEDSQKAKILQFPLLDLGLDS